MVAMKYDLHELPPCDDLLEMVKSVTSRTIPRERLRETPPGGAKRTYQVWRKDHSTQCSGHCRGIVERDQESRFSVDNGIPHAGSARCGDRSAARRRLEITDPPALLR